MLIKGITDEDFINYKFPSMYIATATCSFKCDREYGEPICQNGTLALSPTIDVPVVKIVDRYKRNPITKAVVFGGLEPFDQYIDLLFAVKTFRDSKIEDDIVIYTGYNKDEIREYLVGSHGIHLYRNIIIKFGRYIPGQQPHYDPVLGVYLASDNQYAERI